MIDKVLKKASRIVTEAANKRRLGREGMSFLAPNYIFFDEFNANSVVVDVGCGAEAEFAIHMVTTHGLKAFGVDPTKKHFPALAKLVDQNDGKFVHVQKAVAREKGVITFHQSVDNESGSILSDHNNIQNDEIESYEVETLTITDLKALSDTGKVDYMKLDLEGAEYALLEGIEKATLEGIAQLFVEFHHHCVDSYSIEDTQAIVENIVSVGMKAYTVDQHNYLFAWK